MVQQAATGEDKVNFFDEDLTDDRVITIIEGSDRIGTLYGVYRYLEEIGIRFIGISQKGTDFPSTPSEIPANLKWFVPRFSTRKVIK